MDNFRIKVNEQYWVVQDIAGSLVGDAVTFAVKRLSDGYTWDFTDLVFENAVNTGTGTFITDILWKQSFTPPTEDTYIVTINDTTVPLKQVQVLQAVGGDELVAFSSASETAIANMALVKIGASRLTSIDDESEAARKVKSLYSFIRDEVQRSHPWNFAVDRIALAELAATPAFGYDHQHQLPTNCLRVIGAYGSDDLALPEYKIEGRKLLSDYDTVSIKYIKRVTDPTQFDANFVTLFAIRLAAEIAYAIANSAALGDSLFEQYKIALSISKGNDSQESSSVEVEGADDWIDPRN